MSKIQTFRKISGLILVLGDLFIVPIMYFFSYWIRSKSSFFLFQEKMPYDRIYFVTHHLWFLIVLHILLLYLLGLYDRVVIERDDQILGRTFRAVTLEILILVAIYFFQQNIFPRSIFLLLWIFYSALTSFWHLRISKLIAGHIPIRNLLIVGMNEAAKTLILEIERLPRKLLNIVGVLSESAQNKSDVFCGYKVLGSKQDLLQIVQIQHVDEVVIASESTWQDALVDQISKTDQIPARICIIPSCYEILIGKIKHLRLYDIPLIEMIKHPQPATGKRLLDVVLASLLLVISFPLFLITAAIVSFSSQGPTLYKQIRLGKNRTPFIIFKFRTLVHDAEDETGPTFTEDNDSRLTSVGKMIRKYRLDELPQLLNILKGEMSFVGPRPERPFFVGQYLNKVPGYGERFKATPGLTGLAQVNGGYATTPENKLKYDLAYIYNQSIYLDLRILLETIKVILTGKISN